jgi:sensor histidine kinase YesM
MKTIQSKIIVLSIIVLFFMGSFWMTISYYNQQSVSKYNDILQRYLKLNETITASQDSITRLNDYLATPSSEKLDQYTISKNEMVRSKVSMLSLENQNNDAILQNYAHMLESQIETMDLAMMSYHRGKEDSMTEHFNESIRISQFISETTLSLLSAEVKSYETLYIQMIEQSANLRKLGGWALVTVFMILLIFSYWFSRGITRPISRLTLAAREIAQGKFDQKIEIHTKDEISFLAATFNQMRENIKELIMEIKKKAQLEKELQENQLLLRESELKSLQTQINPHFLFNTLNTLSKKAYLEGADETSELIATVAGLFRYNLRKLDRPVTLSDEVHVIENYFLILQARFSDRFSYQLNMDEECLDIKIPSLILQPFVENAFIHALEPLEEGGGIIVRAINKEDHVLVQIEDDGIGMSEEKIRAILDETPSTTTKVSGHSTGIGLNNAIRRLKLFYQTEDVITIDSALGKGTLVTLKLYKGKKIRREQLG